jgi:transketolase
MKSINTKPDLIRKIIQISYSKKEGHIPSSLSILDILYVVYGKLLFNAENRFVLSKGHASIGYFAILDYFGLLSADINSFCDFDSPLGGHPSSSVHHVECSTGSLGHGMPFALGMSLAKKIKNENGKVYVLIGDGESNEGTIWESALLASHNKLNNLVCIMDHNHSTDRALIIDNVIDKFKSFGWDCISIDGHNIIDIEEAMMTESDKPIFILANTIKGKGCKIMENNPEWHHKIPNETEFNLLIKDIEYEQVQW